MSTPSSKPTSSTSKSSSLSSHLAMVELKSRILTSLSKLSDRDTHQIAIQDLESIIKTLASDALPMLLNSLTHDPPDPHSSSISRRDSLRLISLAAASHPEPVSAHLPKIMAHIAKRLKDSTSDTQVRDACKECVGSLGGVYLKGRGSDGGGFTGLFVKPLLEVFSENNNNKVVQAGAAACLGKVVESGGSAGAAGFQRLGGRVCKLVSAQGVLAKGALLAVFSSLSQVGAITPQNMPQVLQSIRECLDNSDWATRKAAADTLIALASHSSQLVVEGAATTIASLEACRFDKVKPVRDSMMEALQLWKKIAGNANDNISENPKAASSTYTGGKNYQSIDTGEKLDNRKSNRSRKNTKSVKDASPGSSPNGAGSVSKETGSNIPEKAAVILKKKAPPLTDKELNLEFFQKLQTCKTDDLPVEVILPRSLQSSHSQRDELDLPDGDSVTPADDDGNTGHESTESQARSNLNYLNAEKRGSSYSKLPDSDDFSRDKWSEQRVFRPRDSKTRNYDVDDRAEQSQRDPSIVRPNFSRTDGHSESSFMNNKGNWFIIQRQLSQLERQQANLMNMLQDFMGGSHDNMVTLENRVRGLERIVEEMARDLSLSSGRRGSNVMLGFDGSPNRNSSKYNGLHDYSTSKFGRANDNRMPFAERYLSSESLISGVRGRDPQWRSDSEGWEAYGYTASRNGIMSSRRGFSSASIDSRSPRNEHDGDQPGSRRAWEKGQGPFRFGEGPSARSVWQASKDEATLEAIRVAGEDNGTSRIATRTVRELDSEALTDDNSGQERSPLWASWSRAMDSLHVGDVDSAYAEVLSSGDELLIVKLMERTGPIVDQLSNEVASEVLHAVGGQFLLEQSTFDISLAWIQQFTELILENGADIFEIPMEVKKEVLLSLNEVSGIDPPEEWDGATADQMLMQLASSWGIDNGIQQLVK